MTELAIGIDLGATKIAAVLLRRDGTAIAAMQRPTAAQRGSEAVIIDMADLAHQLIADAPSPVSGIGIGSPGQVISDLGVVRNAVNLGWSEVNVVSEMRMRLESDLPIWIAKDANLSALGEYYYGSGRGCSDFVYIGIGSGLGGGVISGNRLITGAGWNAAELGHLSIDPDGWLCACGGRGCAETTVSGPGLVRLAELHLAISSAGSNLARARPLTAADVIIAASQGDELSLTILDKVGADLGIILSVCATVLNPQQFIIGGGLGLAAYQWLAPAAKKEMKRRVLPAIAQQAEIVQSQLSSPAIGAACLAWYWQEMH